MIKTWPDKDVSVSQRSWTKGETEFPGWISKDTQGSRRETWRKGSLGWRSKEREHRGLNTGGSLSGELQGHGYDCGVVYLTPWDRKPACQEGRRPRDKEP